MLYPDKGKAFTAWQEIAEALKPYYNISASNALETLDMPDGADLADVLMHQPLPKAQPVEHIDPETGEIIEAPAYPAAWNEIAPPAPGTAEYSEMLRYELDAYEPNSPEYIAVLQELDPKAAETIQTFEATP